MADIDYYFAKSKKKRNSDWDDMILIEYANEHPTKDDVYEDARCAVNEEILDGMRRKRQSKKREYRKIFRREKRAQKRQFKQKQKQLEWQMMRKIHAKKLRRRFSLSCFLFPCVSAVIWGAIGYVLKSAMEYYFPHINPLYLLGACLVPAALLLLASLKALLFGGYTFGSTLFLYFICAILLIVLPLALVFLIEDDPVMQISAFLKGVGQMPFWEYLPKN